MSQSTPHGGLLIKAPGRGRVAAHNRGIGAKCDTRAARGELPDSSGISDFGRGLNKVAGWRAHTTVMGSLDAAAQVLKICRQKDALSAIDRALAWPTLYGHACAWFIGVE
ncbi:hypothetical protein OAJ78_04150 [Gammaproteobacteria bacterium]|nr:hypothetical protein [Gammaproteobacteria bacterium]